MIEQPRRLPGARHRDVAAPYLFLAPFLVLFVVFAVGPSIATFWLAWWEWDPLAGQRWVGTANFGRLAADPRFWNATLNTLAIAVIATTAQVAVGLAIAHAIHQAALRRTALLRVSFLVPYVTSGAAVAILTAQLVDRNYGAVPAAAALLGFGDVDPLASPAGAWLVVSAMVAWRWFGFTTLLMLAVLESIPRDLYRAAQLDGAGGWAQLRHLSVPLLGPVIAFSFLTSVVGALQLFTEPLLVAPGTITCGPGRQCQTLALLVYELGFRDSQFGYAAAVATTVMIFAAVLVGGGVAASRRWGWIA